jgi:uncharacterized protein (TIGR02271 family)
MAETQSTTPGATDIATWRGRVLIGSDGDKIGKIEEIYMDSDTARPEWALVNTGLLGTKSNFVPLQGASSVGEEVRAEYTKDQVKDAPAIDPDGELSRDEEAELYAHYGLDYSQSSSQSGLPEGGLGTAGQSGEGRGGRFEREDDEAMTRSEEELKVGTAQRETGQARLRKWVETEQVEERVPVARESARVEREPITDENRDAAMRGPEIAESEHEVTLHEEEPVVEKRTVPKERVRLEKDTETDEEQISEAVRKERIEPEGDVG